MADTPAIAYIFPGQGSQKVGMGRDLYSKYPSAKEVFDQADTALGFPLSQLCFQGPEEELLKTVNVQPAILITSIACLRAIHEANHDNFLSARYVAGHSLGEYTALVATNVLSLSDAVKLVRERGRLMYEAGLRNPGGMLAIIGLDEETVKSICFESKTEISNVNCPNQIVISGATDALAEAGRLVRTRGARIIPLKVSGAFHSALMEPITAEFSKVISSLEFLPPTIPIISNITAEPLTKVDSIKKELSTQLRHCIQWQRSVEYMMYNGITTFYEIGPGKVLSGLIRRIKPELQILNISEIEDILRLTS
jgi:[acyl-carrier-protein] S-malonyltransferase